MVIFLIYTWYNRTPIFLQLKKNYMSNSLLNFWCCHPALLYGLAFLLGIFSSLSGSFLVLLPITALLSPFLFAAFYLKKRETIPPLFLLLFTLSAAYLYAYSNHQLPTLPPDGIAGLAKLTIKSIALQPTPFGKNWCYRCEVKQFFPTGKSASIASSTPCFVILPATSSGGERPLANCDYWVEGKLKQTQRGSYMLKISSKSRWHRIPGSWSLAERRYAWKVKVARWLDAQFSNRATATFLAGLMTGEFDDYWMKQQFGRFGLQHLLAISGFHFAIVALFLSIGLQFILPASIRSIPLLVCLGAYCFFLGPQPSILRAWMMCSLALVGGLIEKKSNALNLLGIALLLILGWDPLLSLELGFQLSFAITGAILLFYSPALAFCESLLPKRRLSDALQMDGWNQHAYCILAFFRQGLALTLAINMVAFPLTLYYFQLFPWMSLLYNLFFPFLASVSLCLLLLGSMVTWVPFAGGIIHFLNDHYTFFLLQLTEQTPLEVDHYLKVHPFHSGWIILYLCITYLWGIVLKERADRSQIEEGDFIFI